MKNDEVDLCRCTKESLKSVTLSNGTLVNTNAVLYLLEEYPTAYDVDKVVEQLENDEKHTFDGCINKRYAIEIVKGGGVNGKEHS